MLEHLLEEGAKCVIKQGLFVAADMFLPGSGELLRAADKGYRRGKRIASGIIGIEETLDDIGDCIDNVIDGL
ncbi:MAG: hypothetical protein OSJ62_13565 [Lachnospiraceae bacterium]|nr:hypothetical protein [Lachnospiraceae bacterium]